LGQKDLHAISSAGLVVVVIRLSWLPELVETIEPIG
jgi:hypothetical protein